MNEEGDPLKSLLMSTGPRKKKGHQTKNYIDLIDRVEDTRQPEGRGGKTAN